MPTHDSGDYPATHRRNHVTGPESRSRTGIMFPSRNHPPVPESLRPYRVVRENSGGCADEFHQGRPTRCDSALARSAERRAPSFDRFLAYLIFSDRRICLFDSYLCSDRLLYKRKTWRAGFRASSRSSSSGALMRRHPAHAARRMNLFTIRTCIFQFTSASWQPSASRGRLSATYRRHSCR
jgi:hypothetical protein